MHDDRRLTVLRAGFDALLPPRPINPNIIEVALDDFDPSSVTAWVGYGIGPCCAVPSLERRRRIDTHLMTHRRNWEQLIGRLSLTTKRCPFGPDHVSVNLFQLAAGLLCKAGVRPEAIEIDDRCTCCLKRGRDYVYWSGTRFLKRGGVEGHNLAICWLDTTLTREWKFS
jgi:hypothetical protein